MWTIDVETDCYIHFEITINKSTKEKVCDYYLLDFFA